MLTFNIGKWVRRGLVSVARRVRGLFLVCSPLFYIYSIGVWCYSQRELSVVKCGMLPMFVLDVGSTEEERGRGVGYQVEQVMERVQLDACYGGRVVEGWVVVLLTLVAFRVCVCRCVFVFVYFVVGCFRDRNRTACLCFGLVPRPPRRMLCQTYVAVPQFYCLPIVLLILMLVLVLCWSVCAAGLGGS